MQLGTISHSAAHAITILCLACEFANVAAASYGVFGISAPFTRLAEISFVLPWGIAVRSALACPALDAAELVHSATRMSGARRVTFSLVKIRWKIALLCIDQQSEMRGYRGQNDDIHLC